MLRLMGFFVAVFMLMRLAQTLPGIGRLFHGFVGFWLTTIAIAWALSRASVWWSARRKLAAALVALGHVDSPHNRGKRGALLLAAGRAREAVVELEAAVAGERDTVEWRYRLGLAQLALGRAREAVESLAAAETLAPAHAYGGIQLALARAELAHGEARRALAALERHDQLHGEGVEATYLRGKVLARTGQAGPAREAFASVESLHAGTPGFRRKGQRPWLWRARLARLGLVL